MHIGTIEEEARTIATMKKYIEKNNLANDINWERKHHEIYISDFREAGKEKIKKVLRIPVKEIKYV
jgi:hypothetical protein